MRTAKTISTLTFSAALLASGAASAQDTLLVGDPINGKKLYAKECAACHGDDGKGGRSGVALTDSGRLNLIRDDQMFANINRGAGTKNAAEHSFASKLPFLETWDVVAYVRTLHMTIADFFPKSSRYVSKVYEIDQHGLGRIEKAVGKVPSEKTAAVFTVFDFPGEDGLLTYVPQDPIKLDQLSKDKKAGYLVFLPFKSASFEGELGVGMDKDGKITRLAVHQSGKGADLLNSSLAKFEGLGKKGQREVFKIGGGKPMADLATDIFPVYLRAMESATMYDREEMERTWADQR